MRELYAGLLRQHLHAEMERAAAEAGLPPTRISFVHATAFIREEISDLRGQRLALGTIPSRLAHLRQLRGARQRGVRRAVFVDRRRRQA